MNAPSLFRPSEVARFWELHPKTVYTWIREGLLPAVRTPGDQFRLRATDVRVFAEARNLPIPPFARDEMRRAYVVASSSPHGRAVRRALRQARIEAVAFDSPLDALLACAVDPPALLALDAAARGVSSDEAARSLRRIPKTSALPLLVYNVASASKADALARAGATRAVVRGKEKELATAISEMLG